MYVLIVIASLTAGPEVTQVSSMEACNVNLKEIATEQLLAGEDVKLTNNQLRTGGLFSGKYYYCEEVQ